jgi:hypothetical protein
MSDVVSQPAEGLSIIFRCAPEHKGVVPPPIPAVQGLPDWFKAMPLRAFSETLQLEQMTVKRCPPFIDAMTHGFLIPLATDLRVEDGQLTWTGDIPCARVKTNSSPLDFHDNNQVKGSPFFEEDRFVVKFNCFWTIELPPGYSLLVTHPINRPDLPFVSLTGLIDADLYRDNYINFPARWRDPDFKGVLPRALQWFNVCPSNAKHGVRASRRFPLTPPGECGTCSSRSRITTTPTDIISVRRSARRVCSPRLG